MRDIIGVNFLELIAYGYQRANKHSIKEDEALNKRFKDFEDKGRF